MIVRDKYPEHATSADGLAVCIVSAGGLSERTPRRAECLTFAIEAKTFTVLSTWRQQEELARTYGPFYYLDMDADEEMKRVFRAVIPQTGHRSQLLHHAAILDLPVLYVAANPSEIIRIVVIKFSEEVKLKYLTFLSYVQNTCFPWVQDASVEIPDFTPQQFGRAVS